MNDEKNAWHKASVKRRVVVLGSNNNGSVIYCCVTSYPQNLAEDIGGVFNLGLF